MRLCQNEKFWHSYRFESINLTADAKMSHLNCDEFEDFLSNGFCGRKGGAFATISLRQWR